MADASGAMDSAGASARKLAVDYSKVEKAQDAVAAASRAGAAADLRREQAALNLSKAEQRLAAVMEDGKATDIDRQQAQLNVAKAHQSVASAAAATEGAERRGKRAAEDLSRALDGNSDSLQRTERDAKKATRGFEGLVAAFGGGGDGITRAARAMDGFGGASDGATATLGGFKVAIAALVPVMLGFGGATVSVGSALGPLIGLAPAAGNALAAAAQGVGVFKLATSGVVDALKEQTTNQIGASAAATTNAAAQRSAANAIKTARDGVRSALDGESTATYALATAERTAKVAEDALSGARTEARRALVDMRQALEDAITGEQRAVLGLQDAKDALARTIAGASPEDITRAQEAVTAALHDREQAVLNLDKAQTNLERVNADANATDLERRQAVLDVQQAQDGLTDANHRVGDSQRDLDKLKAGPSEKDKAAAILTVTEAQDALTVATRERVRQTKEVDAAEKAGIAGSPQVVAAEKAIRDAHHAVAEAQKNVTDASENVAKAQQAVRDAQLAAADSSAKAATGAAKLNEKLAALSPPAQEFVRHLISMKPKLDELKATAAGGFFPGATAGLDAAAHNFGSVKKVIGETATTLGDFTKKLGEMVGSKAFGKDIETIGGRNAKVLETMGEATRHIISAIRHLLVAAGPLTQWLADTANKWAEQAASAAKAGRESGKLEAFFERTRAVLERLGSIIGHVAHGLLGIGEAGTSSGNDILKSIDKSSARFDKWANSVKGKTALHEFFEKTKELAAALVPILSGVAQGLGFLTLKFLPLTTILRLLGPYANEVTVAFVAYKFATVAAAIASQAATAAQWLLNAAMSANPAALLVIAIAALTVGLIELYKHSKVFRDVVDATFEVFKKTIEYSPIGVIEKTWKPVLDFIEGVWDGIVKTTTGSLAAVATAMATSGHAIETAWKTSWGAIKTSAIAAFTAVVDGVKALASKFVDAGKWVIAQVIAAIHAQVAPLLEVGGWITNRLAEGIKAVTASLLDAGGWVKNRVVDGIKAVAAGFLEVGGWITNRLADGIKVITEALGSVGGWVKNRVSDLVHAEVDGLVSVGSWITNRVADGIKTLTDALAGVGGWLKNRVKDGLDAVKDGFLDIGKGIVGWIVDGMKKGINKLVDFLNDVIHLINKLPFIPNIPELSHFKVGGTTEDIPGHARGAIVHHDALAGGTTLTRPMMVVGEEAPRHPEFIIPTNPAYRPRAMGLFEQLAKQLGIPGFAEGGVITAFRQALARTGANPKPSLALWEAGIVESGLRNLPYGDRDSRGALQIRDSTAQAMGVNNMDPLASALAFLTRGFWGRGSAIGLAAGNPGATAGWVAQQTQGSAYPDRYDGVRDQALQYLNISGTGQAGTTGGGILGTIGGAISGVANTVAGLIGHVLDVMPSIKDVPKWINPKWFWDKAVDWVKDQASGLLGGGGGGGVPEGVSGNIQDAIALAATLGFARPSENQLTGGTHVADSYHYQGRAADFGAAGHSVNQMKALFGTFLGHYGHHILEMFYDPEGYYIKNGARITGAIGGHSDHLHLALAQGGVMTRDGVVQGPYVGSYALGGVAPRDGLAYVHQGETITPAGEGRFMIGDVYIGGEKIDERVEVKMRETARWNSAAFRAGMRT